MKPAGIRIILDVTTPLYWAVEDEGECEYLLESEKAIELMRQGTPFTIAVADPKDRHSNYESPLVTLFKV